MTEYNVCMFCTDEHDCIQYDGKNWDVHRHTIRNTLPQLDRQCNICDNKELVVGRDPRRGLARRARERRYQFLLCLLRPGGQRRQHQKPPILCSRVTLRI